MGHDWLSGSQRTDQDLHLAKGRGKRPLLPDAAIITAAQSVAQSSQRWLDGLMALLARTHIIVLAMLMNADM